VKVIIFFDGRFRNLYEIYWVRVNLAYSIALFVKDRFSSSFHEKLAYNMYGYQRLWILYVRKDESSCTGNSNNEVILKRPDKVANKRKL
jgi:hypothetical protein